MSHLERLGDLHVGDDTAAAELAPVDTDRPEDAGDPGAGVVSLALAVPLTIVFVRVFASVFEIPFRAHRS